MRLARAPGGTVDNAPGAEDGGYEADVDSRPSKRVKCSPTDATSPALTPPSTQPNPADDPINNPSNASGDADHISISSSDEE